MEHNHQDFDAGLIGGESQSAEFLNAEFPTDPHACVTETEAAFLASASLHRFLRRDSATIWHHANLCDCKRRLEVAGYQLRGIQLALRDLAGGPQNFPLPFADVSADDSIFLAQEYKGKIMNAPEHKNNDRRGSMLFALEQKEHEVPEKTLAARWVAKDTPLRSGAGLLIDAGSQCLFGYEQLTDRINEERFTHLRMLTSNQAVLESWTKNAAAQMRMPNLEIMGGIFDAQHLAFYGADQSRLAGFSPAAVLIGVSGVEFQPGKMLIGYHAGENERKSKQLLLRCRAKRRFILATPSKIGDTGGTYLDVLSEIDDPDPGAPLYLVTAAPPPGSAYETAFEEAKTTLRSEPMVKKLIEKKLVIHWVTVKEAADGQVSGDTETFPANK